MHDAIANDGKRLAVCRLKGGVGRSFLSYCVRTVCSRLPHVKLQAVGEIDTPVNKGLQAGFLARKVGRLSINEAQLGRGSPGGWPAVRKGEARGYFLLP